MTKFENWDSYFIEMIQMPMERIIVQARRSQTKGRRLFNSGSKNNPYLQQDHLVEVPIDINPSSLASRIMAVREQISREFCIDLDLIRIANDQSKLVDVFSCWIFIIMDSPCTFPYSSSTIL